MGDRDSWAIRRESEAEQQRRVILNTPLPRTMRRGDPVQGGTRFTEGNLQGENASSGIKYESRGGRSKAHRVDDMIGRVVGGQGRPLP